MKIQNHKLEASDIRHGDSANQGGTIEPTIIVLHYTASGGEDGKGDADYLSRAAARASAHIVVGRNGSIDQIVPFNKKAWHAGVSKYNGRKNVNDFSIGIEIDNHGWLDAAGRPKLRAEDIFHGKRGPYSQWEKYKPQQLEAVERTIAAICSEYDIADIVGHEDIAPGRKQDPGPALDEFMKAMKAKYVEGKTTSKPKPQSPKKASTDTRTATTNLRLRAGASTTATILTTMPEGAKVTLMSEYRGWSQIRFGNRVGFASSQYLT